MGGRCKAKDKGKVGLWLMGGGLLLVILALTPVRTILLLCGIGLLILGALALANGRK